MSRIEQQIKDLTADLEFLHKRIAALNRVADHLVEQIHDLELKQMNREYERDRI